MIIEFIGLSSLPAQESRFGDALESLVGPIQAQPGCLGCEVMTSWRSPTGLSLIARWETQNDLIQHLQSDIYKRLLLLMELSSVPPVLEFLNVVEIRGLELVEAARMRQS
jgi:quinol monooxygenase YgiN